MTSRQCCGKRRTRRPDLLGNLRIYRDGWDVANKHYWAFVGFTGCPGFFLAFICFILFSLALVSQSCCTWRIGLSKKMPVFLKQTSLVLLPVFTCAALIGCVLLSVGQDEFHAEVMDTLSFVVNQSHFSVDVLRNVTDFLSLAKSISVDQLYLPYDVQNKVDKLHVDLNDAADTLSGETAESSGEVRQVFDNIRVTLMMVAARMLLLAIIGFLLSVLGHKYAVYIFIITGWLLVAVTFILWSFYYRQQVVGYGDLLAWQDLCSISWSWQLLLCVWQPKQNFLSTNTLILGTGYCLWSFWWTNGNLFWSASSMYIVITRSLSAMCIVAKVVRSLLGVSLCHWLFKYTLSDTSNFPRFAQ